MSVSSEAGRGAAAEAALDHLTDFVYVKDAGLRYRYANRAYARFLGQADPTGVEGRSDEDFFDAASLAPLLEAERRLLEDGTPIPAFDQKLEMPDGEIRRHAVAKFLLRDDAGIPEGILVVSRDVTAERSPPTGSESRSRRLYRELFEESVAAHFVADGLGTIRESNPAFRTLFEGRIRRTSGPLNFFALFSEAADAQSLKERLAAETTVRNHHARLHSGERPVHVLGNYRGHFNAEGVLDRITGHLLDVTQSHRLQEELTQVQKMQSLGRLAGGVAHDFNNLLTSILGFATLLQRRVGQDPKARDQVGEIIHAAEKAAGLSRQLLAFGRKQSHQLQDLDLNRLILDLEQILRRTLGEHIDLRIELAPDLGTLRADASQIEQLVLNLAVNARDAMPSGGRLVFRTRMVELDEAFCSRRIGLSPGVHVEFEVEDNGEGMSAEVAEHVFEPFFTTKELGRGTGLGLASVYATVQQAHGHIDFITRPGKGTRFILYFPESAPAAPVRPRTTIIAYEPRGHETVLVVEDETSVRRLTCEMLEDLGYQVVAAASGEEGLQVMAEAGASVDVVVTDVVMPRLHGPDMVRQIHLRHPGLPVVYVSGFDRDIVSHEILKRDHAELLAKPFNRMNLANCIRRALRRSVNAVDG